MQRHHHPTRHALYLAVAVLSLLAFPAAGQDNYPSKPITLVVPYPPGGSNDVFARSMAKEQLLGDGASAARHAAARPIPRRRDR